MPPPANKKTQKQQELLALKEKREAEANLKK